MKKSETDLKTTAAQAVQHLREQATPQQKRAMRELERHGLVFLVHFGTDNAVEKLRIMKQNGQWKPKPKQKKPGRKFRYE